MRKLASIQKIKALEPIEGADAIEKATVLGWQLVVKKQQFLKGEKVVYCEIDSVMPDKPEFEFLKPRGMRIKTVRLRGQVSQGICFPLSILPNDFQIIEDADCTEVLGISKYEPAMPACLSGIAKGKFPSFIPKTDETRCLSEETLIKTEDGLKTIKDICEKKYNGKILSYNEIKNKVEYKKILSHIIQRNINDWYEIILENGTTIRATSNHKFYLPEIFAYRELKHLKEGDYLLIKTD